MPITHETKETSIEKSPAIYLFTFIMFIAFVLLFSIFPPEGIDWIQCYYKVAQNPLHPYEIGLFINPPWIALLLFPFRFISENTSLAVNTTLNLMAIGLLVLTRKGSTLSLVLSLTSFPVLSAIANGNIEWIIALGFILKNEWGVPLLMLKPQVGILAILSWDSFKRKKMVLFLPACLTILLSFVIWGNWLSDITRNIDNLQNIKDGLQSWNSSFFPWSIPMGVFLVYLIVKKNPANSEILGVFATLCIVPYFAIYSIGILYALISARYKRISILLWILLWLYPFTKHLFRTG
jgi:hypothetical protein